MKTYVWLLVSIALSMLCVVAPASEEIYLVDIRETPGKILQLADVSWSPQPTLRPVYTRTTGDISAVAFRDYGKAYFVGGDRRSIFRTDGEGEESVVSSLSSRAAQLEFDSRGNLYFSLAVGDDAKRGIFRWNRRTGQKTRVVELPVMPVANETRGFWNGQFALDSRDQLYVSIDESNAGGSSIYEYFRQPDGSRRFNKRYTFRDSVITAFAFRDARTIYFATADSRVYELRDFSGLSLKKQESSSRLLVDVDVVKVPDQGDCTISGRLRNGRELWNMTSVQALGPNVVWRARQNGITRVSANGRYTLRNLPRGIYRVSTDIRGDTMAGFRPEAHRVNCQSVPSVSGVEFSLAR